MILRCPLKIVDIIDHNRILELAQPYIPEPTPTDHVFWVFDPFGGNVYASPSVEKFFGWTPAELKGTSSYDYLIPSEIASILKYHSKTLEGKVSTMEYNRRCKDGSYLFVRSENHRMLVEGVEFVLCYTYLVV